MATKTPSKAQPKRRNRNQKPDPSDLWPNHLAEIRKSRGRSMTQARLAELISRPGEKPVGQTTIAAIEGGRISGRRYMYRIAEALDVDVKEIFPYAAFMSVADAARAVGARPAQIRKSGVPTFQIKGTEFVKVEDVIAADLKKRVGPSLRERLHYFLKENGPMNVSEIMEEFGPFKNKDEERKRKNTLMVLLSRYPEFIADRSTYPAKWRYSARKHAMAKNGTLRDGAASKKKAKSS